jgi:uncharacterized protein YndB with AHSA1/START domain
LAEKSNTDGAGGQQAAAQQAAGAPQLKVAAANDAAVRRRTGKGWQQWWVLLDAAGAKEMDHPAIIKYLRDKHDLPDWWAQIVTVSYERARNIRRIDKRVHGQSVTIASKPINTTVASAYRAWTLRAERARWLGEAGLTIRGATADKSIRASWGSQSKIKNNLEVEFKAEARGQVRVVVMQYRLASTAEVNKAKRFWETVLGRLKDALESPAAHRPASQMPWLFANPMRLNPHRRKHRIGSRI